MIIAGNFVGGTCDYATPKAIVRSPYDGTVIGSVAEGGWNEANACLDAAQEAFQDWRMTAASERAEILKRVSKSISKRRQELASLLVNEIGKPISLALSEVDRTSLTFALSAEAAVASAENCTVEVAYDPRGQNFDVVYRRFPIGTVLCIVPYNWPLNLAAHKIGPALACGNVAIVKPSPLAPLSTLTLARIVHECGAPRGVIQSICCEPKVAERMATDERTAMLSFTGSPRVGWHLKSLLPEKRVTLELGGNAFAVVLEDAELEQAASQLSFAAAAYAGQICISLQHILVEEPVYERFCNILIAKFQELQFGDPAKIATICGPMISEQAANAAMKTIKSAETHGCSVLAGGNRIGNVVEPTLIESPNHGCDFPAEVDLFSNEVFAPIATVSTISNLESGISIVHASQFGIHASLFTSCSESAARAFDLLNVGGVVVNESPLIRFDSMPYGGVKKSGFGREGISFAIEEMSEKKVLITRR